MRPSSPVWDCLVILTLALALFTQCTAKAQPRHIPTHTRTVLAQALVAEAQTSERDWAAILHVLDRRARRTGWGLYLMTTRYCAAWRAMTGRAQRMRSLDASDGRFVRARAFVGRWARGWVRDPCRGKAWHWGGAMDSPSGRMQALDCGPTKNTFYGLAPKR